MNIDGSSIVYFVAGIGWGIAMTMTMCWLIGIKNHNHDHKDLHDVTEFVGDQALLREQPLSKPDGKAEVLTDMTEEEFKEFQEMELRGWRKFYDQLKKRLGL